MLQQQQYPVRFGVVLACGSGPASAPSSSTALTDSSSDRAATALDVCQFFSLLKSTQSTEVAMEFLYFVGGAVEQALEIVRPGESMVLSAQEIADIYADRMGAKVNLPACPPLVRDELTDCYHNRYYC